MSDSYYPWDVLPALFISTRCRVPLVVYAFHLVSMYRRKGLRNRLVNAWEKTAFWLLRRAHLILVDNEEVRAELLARGLSESQIRLTWNAVSQPGPDFGIVPRRPDEVVFCGRITDTKGWLDLLAVGDRLRAECPGAVLRVLGDGDRRKDLERAVLRRGLVDLIRVEGFVDEETKWRALQRAAAFITPSREEGWGIAVAEAIRAGAEVVCYDLPVYRQVHGDGLHFVPLGDVDAFARRVVELVRNANGVLGTSSVADKPVAGPMARTWDEIADHEWELVFEGR
jgi:glycosyltransferase involved in cell wall biosynthesis